jgi:hypothetical protein
MGSSRAAIVRSRRMRFRRDWNAILNRLRRWHSRARLVQRKLNRAPRAVRIVAIAVVGLAVFSATNFVYQVVRKPTEMFFPVSGTLNKTPAETWQQYAPLFREYSTPAVTPELLAALAQIEGAGNPVARTYWRWSLTWHPFAIYQPASSAVGMYQMTNPAFAEAQRYCIRQHAIVEEGAWYDWDACWFNSLYTRVVPSHAIELAAVYLERNVAMVLARRSALTASLQQKQDLAAIIHLCGAGPAKAFAGHGFHPLAGERCGDHRVAAYLAEINAMKQQFLRLGAER